MIKPEIFPSPQKVSLKGEEVNSKKRVRIVTLGEEAEFAARKLRSQIEERVKIEVSIKRKFGSPEPKFGSSEGKFGSSGPKFASSENENIILMGTAKNRYLKRICLKSNISEIEIPEEGYRICLMSEGAKRGNLFSIIIANDRKGMIYATYAFLRLIRKKAGRTYLPIGEIIDYPANKIRPITISVGWGQIFEGPSRWNLKEWFTFLDLLSEYRYNLLYLLNWESDLVFPFDWQEIKHYRWIREYGLLPTLLLDRWDGRKFVREKWRHPFLENPKMLKEILEYARNQGIKIGYFNDPKFFCAYKEDGWVRYWRHILKFLIEEYQFEAFIFEEEETPEPYDHLTSCPVCRKRWGKLPLGRVRFEAYKNKILVQIIREYNPRALVSTVPHYSLYKWGMFFDPSPTERNWIEDKKRFRKALNEFKKLAPEDLLFSSVPGDHNRELWLKVFGPERIIKGGYNGYWPTISEEKEINQPAVANSLWRGESLEKSRKRAANLLFGKRSKYPQLLKRMVEMKEAQSIRDLEIFEKLDNPAALREMKELFEKDKTKFDSYLSRVKKVFKKTRTLEEEMAREINKIESDLVSSWSPKENAIRILNVLKKSVLSLEYLVEYGELLSMKKANLRLLRPKVYQLEKLGREICNSMSKYIPDWPGTGSRIENKYGGRYTILEGNPFIYDGYLNHARRLRENLKAKCNGA